MVFNLTISYFFPFCDNYIYLRNSSTQQTWFAATLGGTAAYIFNHCYFCCCQFWSIKVLSQKVSLYQQKRQFACLTTFSVRFVTDNVLLFVCFCWCCFPPHVRSARLTFFRWNFQHNCPFHPSPSSPSAAASTMKELIGFQKAFNSLYDRVSFSRKKFVYLQIGNYFFFWAAEKKEGNTNRHNKTPKLKTRQHEWRC